MSKKNNCMLVSALVCVMSFFPSTVMGENYFSLGINDTLRVPEACLGGQMKVKMHAHFDGWLESWTLTMSFPEGSLTVAEAQPGSAMSVPYTNRLGESCIYQAVLSSSADNLTLSSHITEYGYWDAYNDGRYIMYGTVKWSEGYFDDMVLLTLDIPSEFTGCTMNISGWLLSTNDFRGVGTVSGMVNRNVEIVVGRRVGDIDGDDKVDIADVTGLIDLLLVGGEIPSGIGDVDGDGMVGITDVTQLIDLLLGI